MKTIWVILICACSLLSSKVYAQDYDDVYGSRQNEASHYSQKTHNDQQRTESEYSTRNNYSTDQQTYTENRSRSYSYDQDEYIDYNDDYYYTSRLRRFHNSYWGFGYYSSFYMDPFWWDMSYEYPNFYVGWGYPSWYYGNYGMYSGWPSYYYYSYNPCGAYYWNQWGYPANWNCGFHSCFGWGSPYGYGYYNGYNHGYWDGYWNGYNNGGYGYSGFKGSSTTYGPRSSSNSGVRFNRGSLRSVENPALIMTDGRRSLNNTSSGNGLNTHQMSDAGQHAQPYHNEVINRDVQTQQSHTGDKNNEGSGIDRTPNRYNNTDPVKDHERQPYQNRDWNDSRTIPDRNTPVQENNHSNPRQEQQPDNWRNNPRQEREDPVRMREDRPDNNRAVPRNEPNSLPDRRQEGGRRENRMPSVRSESPRMESPRMSSGGGGGGSVRGKRR